MLTPHCHLQESNPQPSEWIQTVFGIAFYNVDILCTGDVISYAAKVYTPVCTCAGILTVGTQPWEFAAPQSDAQCALWTLVSDSLGEQSRSGSGYLSKIGYLLPFHKSGKTERGRGKEALKRNFPFLVELHFKSQLFSKAVFTKGAWRPVQRVIPKCTSVQDQYMDQNALALHRCSLRDELGDLCSHLPVTDMNSDSIRHRTLVPSMQVNAVLCTGVWNSAPVWMRPKRLLCANISGLVGRQDLQKKKQLCCELLKVNFLHSA